MRSQHFVGKKVTLQPNAAQLTALNDFAKRNGRFWKQKLQALWLSGNYRSIADSHLLHQIRNQFGPEFLISYRVPR